MRKIEDLILNNKEAAFGRFINEDGSVSPSRDTGFRMTAAIPNPYFRPERRIITLLNSDQFHNNEVTRAGDVVAGTPLQTAEWKPEGSEPIVYGGTGFTALAGVNFVTVDQAAAEKRNVGYIRENIARRIEHEKSVKENISSLQA